MRLFPALAVLAAFAASAVAPRAAEQTDLREFRLGMPAAALPATGYVDFACADDPSRKLAGWSDYKSCPVDAHGLHAVGFRYDDALNEQARINEDAQGTKVGGHAVLIAALIGDDAKLDGLWIRTDPHVRLYMHKKAFLFASQARARYGETGWTCTEGKPTADEQPIGELFLKEHCDKLTATRHFEVDRELFQNPAEGIRNFTSGSQLTILLPGVPG